MKAGKVGNLQSVQGIITPSDWDASFNVIAIKISASGEKEYLVKTNAKGIALMAHTQKMLRVIGRISGDKKGNTIIEVEDFEPVNV